MTDETAAEDAAAPLGRMPGSVYVPNVWETLRDDSAPDPGPAPDFFTVVHLIWLRDNGYIDALPTELGPYPMAYRAANPDLGDQLQRWGVVDGERLTEAGSELLSALLGGYEWALFGKALYPVARQPVHVYLPQHFIDFGVDKALRDVPRTPFMVCVRRHEVISVLSTVERMFIGRHPLKGRSPEHVAADALRLMFDPAEIVKPLDIAPATANLALTQELAADPRIGNADDTDEGGKARAKATQSVRNKLADAQLNPSTVDTMSLLAGAKIDVTVNVSIIDDTRSGFTFPKDLAGAVHYTTDGVLVAHPTFPPVGAPQITYRPGDADGFIELVRGLRATARRFKA